MYWQNRKDRVSEKNLCASERSERAIFGVFNSFTVKKVTFFTINVKSKVILSSKSGGGGIFVQAIPPPKKVGGGGGGGYIPPPPGFTPVIIITNSYIAHLITVRNINALYRQKWNKVINYSYNYTILLN